jgi:FkbM family methyltransferase
MLSTMTKIKFAKCLSKGICLGRSLVGKGRRAVVSRDGLQWELDLCEGIDLSIYLFGAFERETAKAICSLLRQGTVALDIGANIGAHALPMARCVGDSGRVFAFEPTAFAFKKLQRNVGLNRDLGNRIVLEQIMLGDLSDTDVPEGIYSSWPLAGSPHVHGKHRGRLMPTTGARTSTIDDYVRKAGITRVDLIKLDVDGHECAVLRGSGHTLERDRPLIIMELAPYVLEEAGASLVELCHLLGHKGYRMKGIPRGKLLPLDPQGLLKMVPDGCGINVVAVPLAA